VLSLGEGENVMSDPVELKPIQEALESFIEKHGGQYICTVIWPEEPAQKATVPLGSSHVRTMTSKPYNEAVKAMVDGEVMFRKR
jgi:hypothetical protein